MPNEPLIRRLGEGDVLACVTVAKTVGWRSSEAQWTMMLGVGAGFGAEVGGALAGTVIVNRFDALASIAMMVVDPAFQRRGIGRRLMDSALAHARGAAVFLYATEIGRTLYESLGFVEIGTARRMSGRVLVADPEGDARPMRSRDLPAVHALDEEAQGAPRRPLLDALVANVDRATVVERSGAVVAFGLSSLNDGRRIISPIVAREDAAARMVAAHLCAASDLPVCIDLPSGEETLVTWAEHAGLKVEDSTAMMVLQGSPLPGRRALIRALAGRAFG